MIPFRSSFIGIAAAVVCCAAYAAPTPYAGPMARFELNCTDCLYGGTFSRTWVTPFAAAESVGFLEGYPYYYFSIEIPEYGATFWAHSEYWPSGYNYQEIGSVAASTDGYYGGTSTSLIFDGPTSAPVWRVGVYEDVAHYFRPGNYGQISLTISEVPAPATLALALLGLVGVGLSRRRRA